MRPANEQSEVNWAEVERKVSQYAKKYSLLGITLLGLLLSFTFGSQALALFGGGQALTILGGIAAFGMYSAYPKEIEQWFDTNKPTLLGAAIGFFATSGSLPGLVLGAWLGHYIQTTYLQLSNAANHIAQVMRPVIAPGNWIKEKAGAAYQNTLSGLKSAGQAIIGSGEPDEQSVEEEPDINFTTIINSGRNLFNKGTDLVATGLSSLASYLPAIEENTPPINTALPLASAPVYLASQGPGPVEVLAEATTPVTPTAAVPEPDAQSKKKKKRWQPMTLM